jgi:uncharacterized protein YuzB (UPF0349 family)
MRNDSKKLQIMHKTWKTHCAECNERERACDEGIYINGSTCHQWLDFISYVHS